MGIGTTEKYDPGIGQSWSLGLRIRRAGHVTTLTPQWQNTFIGFCNGLSDNITNSTNKLLLISKVKNKRILLILYCTIWRSVQTYLTSKRHWLLKKGNISVKYTVAQSWNKLFQFALPCNQDWLPFLSFFLRYRRRIFFLKFFHFFKVSKKHIPWSNRMLSFKGQYHLIFNNFPDEILYITIYDFQDEIFIILLIQFH